MTPAALVNKRHVVPPCERASPGPAAGRRLAAALAAAAVALSAPGCARTPRPDIVLIVIDTLRADHLGAYGYARAQTPRLDALAAAGTRFDAAYATCSWTLPSVASILTGRYPVEHGAQRLSSVLGDAQVTLAETLAAAGYQTFGISANTAVVNAESGLAQGFARFEVIEERGPQSGPDLVWMENGTYRVPPEATADVVTDAALAMVAARDASRPYFLYAHYFDPHSSYSPPLAYALKFGVAADDPMRGPAQRLAAISGKTPPALLETLKALYDAEIAFMDTEIGRLIDGLGLADTPRHTVVVVTADHGEEFADHGGIQHGRSLYQEMLHVPLFVAGGGFPAGRVVGTTVSSISIVPTLAELARAEAPPGLAGRSLVAELRGGAAPSTALFADLPAGAVHRSAVIDDAWKLVLDRGFRPILYDLVGDPGETRARNDGEAARAQALQRAIGEHNKAGYAARAAAPPGERVLDDHRRDRLRALGYVE
ncbi:MAG: hypothetical protein B6D46_09030 [Polyangiaceae bacterium UTPRO1]|nr:MAG: hypothetical protein B6D46_09030 [Polyangiaceae bacterium UTPRO1]